MSSWANKDIPRRKGFALFNFNFIPVVLTPPPPPPPAPVQRKKIAEPVKSKSIQNVDNFTNQIVSRATEIQETPQTTLTVVNTAIAETPASNTYFENKILDFFKLNPVVQNAIESYIESKFLEVFKLNKSIHSAIELYMESKILDYLKVNPTVQSAVEAFIDKQIQDKLKSHAIPILVESPKESAEGNIDCCTNLPNDTSPYVDTTPSQSIEDKTIVASQDVPVIIEETPSVVDKPVAIVEEISGVVEATTSMVEEKPTVANETAAPIEETPIIAEEKVDKISVIAEENAAVSDDNNDEQKKKLNNEGLTEGILDKSNITKLLHAEIFKAEQELLKTIVFNLPKDTLETLFQIIDQENQVNVELPPQKSLNKKFARNYNVIDPKPSAVELKDNDSTIVFVILRHIINPSDNKLWTSAYNSVRKFYLNKVIIIDDNSIGPVYETPLVNTEIIRSEFPGAAELLPYYYFLKYKWADKMIILQDTMFLDKGFDSELIKSEFKFHWYFKPNDSDDRYKILLYLTLLKNNSDLITFFNSNSEWFGCFGAAGICNYEKIKYLNDKYDLFNILKLVIKNRKDRETFERVIGIVVFYEQIVSAETCSSFGDIVKYPMAFELSPTLSIETALHNIQVNKYNTSIVKMWRGR